MIVKIWFPHNQTKQALVWYKYVNDPVCGSNNDSSFPSGFYETICLNGLPLMQQTDGKCLCLLLNTSRYCIQ